MSPTPHPIQHDGAEVRKALQAILWSAEFAASERLSRFLSYIVEQYLEGNTGQLKEAVIGVEVFDRDPGYDPKIEPIVRTEARRLRAKLDAYYENAGKDHAVRIMVPKGGYVPQIEIVRPRILEMPAPVPAHTPRSERRWPIYAAAAACLIAILAVIVWLLPRKPQASFPPPKQLNVTSLPGREMSPSFSPDGSQIVFSWQSDEPGRSGLYITMTKGGPIRRLTNDAADRFPSWSPDGNWIAFDRADRDIMLIRPLGGDERRLTNGSGFSQIAWAPDGKSIAITSPGDGPYRVFTVSVPSGERHVLTNPPKEYVGDYQMAFSPDGRDLAFTRCRVWSCDINVISVSGANDRTIAKTQLRVIGLVWTPDGQGVVFASGRRGFMRLYRASVNSPGEPALVTAAIDDAFMPAIWRNRLAYVHEDVNINIWQMDGSGARRRLIGSSRVESSPQISPDGTRIAFVSDRSGFDEIWTANRDGGNAAQITYFTEGSAGSPRWSPDSRQIAFDHLTAFGRTIYAVDAAGGSPRPITGAAANVSRPSWSRDGKWIYYSFNDGKEWQVWKVETQSPFQRQRVTGGSGFEAWESLDGSRLYYVRGTDLWTKALPAGPEERLLPSVHHGWWSVTAAGIYFVRFESEFVTGGSKPIYFYDFPTRQTNQVASIDGNVFEGRPDFCVSSDGKTILFGLQELSNTDIRMVENFR